MLGRPPRCRDLRILLSLGAILVLALGSLGCGSSGHIAVPAAASPPPGLQTIFEDEGHLHSDPAGTLTLMRQLGVDRVRVYVPWQSVAPQASARSAPRGFDGANPAAYPPAGWSGLDTIVQVARRHGVALDLTVGGPVPLWATSPGAPQSPYLSWKPSAAQFGAFMRALGTRYSGRFTPPGAAAPLPRVDFWSVWNEPNYGPDLAPQAVQHSTVEVSPALYRGLLDAAWSALGATGHGHDTILIGETAPRGITTGDNPGNFSGMVPLRFIRALYCVGGDLHRLSGAAATARGCPAGGDPASFVKAHPALFGASGFADHPYSQGGMPPDVPTPGEPDYADLPSLPRLESTLDRARAAYGSFSPLPIFSTEFGYQTDPPETIEHTTAPPLAARYLNWSEYISWRDSRVRSYDQFLLTDPANAGASGGFATGLEFKDRRPKATLAAFRLPVFLPASGRTSQGTEVWGCARGAARDRSGPTQVQIQFRASGGGAFRTVATVRVRDPHGYFDIRLRLPARGQVRLRWAPAGMAPLLSRVATLGLG